MLLFSWVGIPKCLLMEQSTPFISKLMVDLCQVLQVKHLKTSVYYSQTDSLVERFNQTLKWMLRQVVHEEGLNWAYSSPTSSLPCETLLRPLQVLHLSNSYSADNPGAYWTPLRKPGRSSHPLIDYIQEMQERIERVAPIVQEHMPMAQRE